MSLLKISFRVAAKIENMNKSEKIRARPFHKIYEFFKKKHLLQTFFHQKHY